jgi:protein tyrosine/serine phosphatase
MSLRIAAAETEVPVAAPDDAEAVAEIRPAAWATKVERPGLPNLHMLTPMLYRGAQPTAEGMRELEKMGVKTVLSLRAMHDDDDELENLSLKAERIRFNTWNPEREDVARFFEIVTDPARQPVFVHCLHGADRTGMMCAVYRVAIDGWAKDEALKEMTTGGFGFHKVWKDVLTYVRDLDVEALRKEAKLPRP